MSYLTPLENLSAFFDCDDKLGCNRLLGELRYSIDINLTFLFVTSKMFRHLCGNVFPYLSSQIEFLGMNTTFVGNSIVYCLPNLLFRNLKSLHLHSVNEDYLTYVLDESIHLKYLIVGNVNNRSIDRIFEGYLHRLESFSCDNLLPVRMKFCEHPYELTNLSISLIRLSLLASIIDRVPQLKYLKVNLCTCDDVDKEERRRLFQMIKSDQMKHFTTLQSFSLISYVKMIPWIIFVQLVKSMDRLNFLFFDYIVEWAPSPTDARRYAEIIDENWNSSAANYLSDALESLHQLINVSFHLIISECEEEPDKSRWKSSFWPKTNWIFNSTLRMAYLYTLPWSRTFHNCPQFYDELNCTDIDHSIKQCAIGPILGQFARISQRFPKVQHLQIDVQRSITSPSFTDVSQSLIHCKCLSIDESTPGFFVERILPYLPNVRQVTLLGDIDQLFGLATCRSSTIVLLSLMKWTDESIHSLNEQYFPNLEHLFLNLFERRKYEEIELVEETIEQSFIRLPNLISLHYSNLKTTRHLSQSIQSHRYKHFFHFHHEKTRIVLWK